MSKLINSKQIRRSFEKSIPNTKTNTKAVRLAFLCFGVGETSREPLDYSQSQLVGEDTRIAINVPVKLGLNTQIPRNFAELDRYPSERPNDNFRLVAL